MNQRIRKRKRSRDLGIRELKDLGIRELRDLEKKTVFRQLPIKLCEKNTRNSLQSLGSLFQKRHTTLLKRVKLFATCLVSDQGSGFMDYVKEIVFNSSIPKSLNSQFRFIRGLCMIPTACLVFFMGLAYGGPSKTLAEPVYKEMRAEKTPFDPGKIPDPFLSYLIKRGQQASAKAEGEKKKELEAEERMKQQKLAAEEMLKRQKLAAAEKLKALKKAKTELQKMGLSQLTLTAIVQAGDVPWAMVRDESGRGFVLKKGTYIGTNGGVVSRIAIAEKKIVIEEPYLEKGLYIKYKPVEIALPDQVYK